MIFNKIGAILFLIGLISNDYCYSQDDKKFQLIIIDNELEVKFSDDKNPLDSIDWKSLPHCSHIKFEKMFEQNPRINNGVSISDSWKKEVEAKIDTCSIIVMIRFQGGLNLSRGGDNINCFLIGDNDKVDIMKTGLSHEMLFSFETNNGLLSIHMDDFTLHTVKKDCNFSATYRLKGIKGYTDIYENLTVKKLKKVTINSTYYGCM